MKKWSRIFLTFSMMALVCISLAPSSVFSWKQEASASSSRPYFTTHQWLANESLNLSPSSSRVQWITNNLLAFWHGVEAPYNSAVAAAYAVTAEDYGDIGDLVLYLDAPGTSVTNSSLADRAQDEYDSLVAELAKDEMDESLAAFYAGAMTHYVSQAGVWGAIWDESLWGTLPAANWISFENQIEASLDANYFDDDQDEWINTLFTLVPTIITPVDAYDATVDLAMNIHPVAQSLGDDFENDWTEVANWTTVYKDDVTDCLTDSVEAIYAALDHAMISVNWNAITTDDPVYTYDNLTGFLEIPDFSVTFTNNTGTYNLAAADAELAEFRVIIYPENAWEDPILSSEHEDLQFNAGTQKWYHDEHLVKGTSAQSDHTILYTFKMNQSSLTWSNASIDFSVDFFKINLTSIITFYDPADRTVDITHVIMDIYEIPEVRELDPTEVLSAKWTLYTKGEGAQVSEAIGLPAYDTEGTQPHGNLTYDAVNQSWYAVDIDIGLVFTAVMQQYYVVVQFEVIGIPVGYYKNSSYGQAEFIAACIGQDNEYWFATRDHQITISVPEIIFDVEDYLVSVYNITAFSDYKNTLLDFYELEQKPIYEFAQDVRAHDCKVFLYDGIKSSITEELQWDFALEYWFVEDIDVSALPDNDYYISAKIANMNVNATTSPWGPASIIFTINRPMPVIFWILPEFFVVGFVVLFGWLAWWRPRQKRLQIEIEREAKIDKGFMD